MNPGQKFGMLILLVLCVAGCSETQQEIAMRDKFPSYPEEIKDAIKGGYLVKGMDQDQVLLALGPTSCVATRSAGGKTYASWAYMLDTSTYKIIEPPRCFESEFKPYTVYFENGRVTQWDY
jgi:outer membrane protein assembly factor BamE (lipoprotein component of BamABCDE complex)